MKARLATIGRIGLIGLIGLIGHLLVPASQAQTPSPTPVSDEAVEDIRQAVREEVQKRLEETGLGEKRAVVGTLTDIVNTTLVLATRAGEVNVSVASEAAILRTSLRGRQEIDFEDLELEEYAIVMGYLDEKGELSARRIVVADRPEPRDRFSVFGQVTTAEDGDLTLRHPQTGQAWTVVTSAKTSITTRLAGKREEIDFEAIKQGDSLVVIGRPDKDLSNTLQAILIHRVSGQETE